MSLIGTWGNVPGGKHADGPGPEGLVLADEAIDPRHPSLGSALDDGMNRSGNRFSASAPVPAGSPTPINPFSIPQRSISRTVTRDRVVDVLQAPSRERP